MKELKKKSFFKLLPALFFLFVLGGVIFGFAMTGIFTMSKGAENFEELDFSKNIEGKYVKAKIEFIYDYTCEKTSDKGKLMERDYLMDADDFYYIVLNAKNSNMTKADLLMYASQDYMDGETDESAVYARQYEVTGTIKRLSGDRLKYYYEYVDYYSLPAEEKEMFLPYVLEIGEVGSVGSSGSVYVFLIVGIILLGSAIFMVVMSVTGGYQKMITKYLADNGNSEMVKGRVETFLAGMDKTYPLYFNEQFICGQSGAKTIFGETDKLAWVYQKTITHKRYFITVGHNYYVCLGFTDGKVYDINMKKLHQAEGYVEDIANRCPKVFAGYSDQINNMFHKNRAEFLKLKYYAQDESVYTQDSTETM